LKTIKITRCCCDAWNTVRRHTAAQAQYGTIWHRAQSSRIWSTGLGNHHLKASKHLEQQLQSHFG
jgi:hypothetical protein